MMSWPPSQVLADCSGEQRALRSTVLARSQWGLSMTRSCACSALRQSDPGAFGSLALSLRSPYGRRVPLLLASVFSPHRPSFFHLVLTFRISVAGSLPSTAETPGRRLATARATPMPKAADAIGQRPLVTLRSGHSAPFWRRCRTAERNGELGLAPSDSVGRRRSKPVGFVVCRWCGLRGLRQRLLLAGVQAVNGAVFSTFMHRGVSQTGSSRFRQLTLVAWEACADRALGGAGKAYWKADKINLPGGKAARRRAGKRHRSGEAWKEMRMLGVTRVGAVSTVGVGSLCLIQ